MSKTLEISIPSFLPQTKQIETEFPFSLLESDISEPISTRSSFFKVACKMLKILNNNFVHLHQSGEGSGAFH